MSACFLSVLLVACGAGNSETGEESPARSTIESSPAPPRSDSDPPPVDQAWLKSLHKGVDVSGHSGEIDWNAVVAAGQDFAFLKATEGMDLQDPAFAVHWLAAKKARMTRGAYHFYVTEDDPEKQARFFIETVILEAGDLAPVVDIELIGHGTEPGLAGRLRTWLSVVEAHYGVKPIIYTSPNFWDQHLTADFGDYPLWVAEYGVEAPRLPKGWDTWHLWQWQNDATVAGVEKGADLNRLHRNGPDLSVLFVPEQK
ncbi:MAG: glycoside hydrolase family 25 protein [Deltaproteobacteria bacterium]|nr:glycoside hydrolase family 25 protein [Deltaproteobacteria bacterium]